MHDMTDMFKDSEGNDREEIDIEGFKLALRHVDTQMKSLPATAQVLTVSTITEQSLMQTPFAVKCNMRIKFSMCWYRLLPNKVHI